MLTEFHKNNIRKLVDFIPTIPEGSFDMTIFRPTEDRKDQKCNTVGCILGHATVLDSVKSINKFRKPSGRIEFDKWSTCFFGFDSYRYKQEWDYLFAAEWQEHHNTKEAALARVKTFIANYFNMPEKWSFDSPNLDGSIE